MTDPHADQSCDVAHGHVSSPPPAGQRTLVAVFASQVAGYLLRYAQDAGYRPVLLEPDARARRAWLDEHTGPGGLGEHRTQATPGITVLSGPGEFLDDSCDVVVTDHHRPELGIVLRDALAGKPRWVGVMGNPRHPAPHVPALAKLGVPEAEIARVHRPIGLNIGSRTPAEIAVATLGGLIADRNGRPGGFSF